MGREGVRKRKAGRLGGEGWGNENLWVGKWGGEVGVAG